LSITAREQKKSGRHEAGRSSWGEVVKRVDGVNVLSVAVGTINLAREFTGNIDRDQIAKPPHFFSARPIVDPDQSGRATISRNSNEHCC
jgi:hypothetical protein